MGPLFVFVSFIAGLFILHGRTNKTLLWICIPQRMIIPLRIILSTVLLSISISISIFHHGIVVKYQIIYAISLLLIAIFSLININKDRIFTNWWKNIVYFMIITFTIWLMSREQLGKMGIVLSFIPLIALFTTLTHLLYLLIQSFIRKQFKQLRYCVFSYLLIIIAYYSLAGYRNFNRNYTLQESQKANALLWPYKFKLQNRLLSNSSKLQIKEVYAEQDFSFHYDNWFSYVRTVKKHDRFYINIIFSDLYHIHHSEPRPYYYKYHNMLRYEYDSIQSKDTIFIPFNYSLIHDEKTNLSDTLLLIRPHHYD